MTFLLLSLHFHSFPLSNQSIFLSLNQTLFVFHVPQTASLSGLLRFSQTYPLVSILKFCFFVCEQVSPQFVAVGAAAEDQLP